MSVRMVMVVLAGGLPGTGRWAVAADDLPGGAADLAGAVRVDGQLPAQLVQDDVVVPPAVVLEVGQAGPSAVVPVLDVVWFAAGRGLVAAVRMLPQSTRKTGQATWMTC